MNYSEKNKSAAVDSSNSREALAPRKTGFRYTSDSYQKILDYHVVEILLTTVIFGVVVLIRLHH